MPLSCPRKHHKLLSAWQCLLGLFGRMEFARTFARFDHACMTARLRWLISGVGSISWLVRWGRGRAATCDIYAKIIAESELLQRPLMRFISFASNIGPVAAVPAGPAPTPLLIASLCGATWCIPSILQLYSTGQPLRVVLSWPLTTPQFRSYNFIHQIHFLVLHGTCLYEASDTYSLYPSRDGRVSKGTSLLIQQLIELDATKRLTASRGLETAQRILSRL